MKTHISLGSIFQKSKNTHEHSIERDWLIVLAGFAVVMILIAAHATYFYRRVENGALYGMESVPEDENAFLDTELLDRVAARIEEREQWPETVAAELPRVVDPSH